MPTTQAETQEADQLRTVRLHITPLKPELLRVYLAPSVLPLARNVSYHTVETFPEKGFGYVELPDPEAQKLRKKLNGTTLKGSKVRIEMAKPEKRKAREEADAEDKPAKRSKKDKKEKKEKRGEKRVRSPGVFDGVELPEDRKVKRGWTEPVTAKSRSKSKDKDDKHQSRPSKYTKEPELLFKAKLEPVAATEHTRKEKKKDKKDKKERKTKTKEVIVHEFEKNTKTPSFLKAAKVSMKPPVDYVDGVGWVDEDGAVVEPETKKAAHSRVLQLVDGQPLKEPPPTDSQGRPIVKKDVPKHAPKQKKKKVTPPPESSSESELDDESSVVSSSSEDEDSSPEDESDEDDESERPSASPTPSPAQTKPTAKSSRLAAPTSAPTSSTVTESKEVHPLEALFKRAPPPSLSTPTKPPPINTSFSFFDNETTSPPAGGEPVGEPIDAPTTPFTQRDMEWRGQRSAAPTPDTAAIGRRFSFDWRKESQEADDDEDLSDGGIEAGRQLDLNTKANSQALADVQEVDENDGEEGAEGKQEESEFRKWFWENRGDINRAWKKRRREALKAKRHADNRKMTGGRRVG